MDYGSQKQIAPQVMMATTNGTFGSQTFGISSGTSGCTNDGVIMKNKHINMTSRAFESLAQEMAQGRGKQRDSLKANAKRQPRHHVGVRPSSRVDICEVEQEGGGETHLLVQSKVQAYADRDQKGGIGCVEVGMQKAEPPLQVYLQSRIESGQVEPILPLSREAELK
jgi:hypothetical protein